MSRIGKAFDSAGRIRLVGYLMGGDPRPSISWEIARSVFGEVDLLELGVPFSDPLADGPTIQEASARSLRAGTRLRDVLGLGERLRSLDPTKPLLLMTYANIPFRQGWREFARRAVKSGFDGAVVPDLPLEESEEVRRIWEREGFDLVLLATPLTSPERLERIAHSTRGFLYLVSTPGVTGKRESLDPRLPEFLKRARSLSPRGLPLVVGFGISTPDHLHLLTSWGADGAVVGSALVEKARGGPSAAIEFLRALRGSPPESV